MTRLLPRLRRMTQAKLTAILLLIAMTSLVMAADTDNNLLKNDGSLDRLFKQAGVYNTSAPARRRVSWSILPGLSHYRTIGSWARSAAFMSTRMTISGSTTARAR